MNLDLVLDRANRYLDKRILSVPKVLEFTWQDMEFTCRYKEVNHTTSNLNFCVNVGRMPYSAENQFARQQLFEMSQTLLANGSGRLNISANDGQVYFEGWTKVGRFDNSADVIIESTIAILKHRELLFEIRPLTIRNEPLRKIG